MLHTFDASGESSPVSLVIRSYVGLWSNVFISVVVLSVVGLLMDVEVPVVLNVVGEMTERKCRPLLGDGGRYLSGSSREVSWGVDGRALRWNKANVRRKRASQAVNMDLRKRRMKISMPTS